MKLRHPSLAILTAALLIGLALVAAPAAAQTTTPIAREFVPGEILVSFEPATSLRDKQDAERSIGSLQSTSLTATIRKLTIARGREGAAISALRTHAGVRFAELNYIVHALVTPNDPEFPNLWGLRNTGQVVNGVGGTPGADISATSAWDVSTGSPSVVVGDVDSGLDYTHLDLAPNIWSNPGGVENCPAGTHGYNAVARTCDPMDDNNHGTHTAGTIGAAGNNALGVVGVNWHTSLMGLKFLDATGSGSTADAITAIDFAVTAKANGQANVRALNNSWGGPGFSQALLDEINKAAQNDILFVVAAGNNATNHAAPASYPCDFGYWFNAANVICVAASDQNDKRASFSDYGVAVHLAAPGTNIRSTIPNNGYAYYQGTSMATPHVTGAAALILSSCSTTTAGVKNAILNNVDTPAALNGVVASNGRLNVDRAIRSCSVASPDFTLTVSPVNQSATPGSTSSPYTITVSSSGGFSNTVNLGTAVVGGPVGASGVSAKAPAASSVTVSKTSTGQSSFTASSTSSSTPGAYTIRVTAAGGTPLITHTADVTFTVGTCVVNMLAAQTDQPITGIARADVPADVRPPSSPARLDPLPFRRLRDELLVQSAQGRHFIALYNAHSPEVVRLMLVDAELRTEILNALLLWQTDVNALVDSGGQTVKITSQQVQAAERVLDRLTQDGSPALRQDIQNERELQSLAHFAGQSLTSAARELLGTAAQD